MQKRQTVKLRSKQMYLTKEFLCIVKWRLHFELLLASSKIRSMQQMLLDLKNSIQNNFQSSQRKEPFTSLLCPVTLYGFLRLKFSSLYSVWALTGLKTVGYPCSALGISAKHLIARQGRVLHPHQSVPQSHGVGRAAHTLSLGSYFQTFSPTVHVTKDAKPDPKVTPQKWVWFNCECSHWKHSTVSYILFTETKLDFYPDFLYFANAKK